MNTKNNTSRRKVLVISYYWPPSGGSSVLRWLKFTKYLGAFNWDVTIYTPSNPEPQAFDESLLNEIPDNITLLKTKILEPYSLYKLFSGKSKEKGVAAGFINSKKKNFLSGISIWIRGNVFIPDARKFWIKPSVKYLRTYLNENPHDVVVSTGPPHSMHLIAQKIKKLAGISWVADFRDPWTNIDFYKELKLSRKADRKHHQLEKEVLTEADKVITVSPTMTDEFRKMGCKNVSTITNGFDSQPAIKKESEAKNKFTILHIGSMPKSRNPEILWKVLKNLTDKDPEFRAKLNIELVGHVDVSVYDSLKENQLKPFLVSKDFVPNQEVLKLMTNASVLLLVINNTPNAAGILTNKFFEYLSVKNPILAVGPVHGDAAKILIESGAGKMLDYNDENGISEFINELFLRFKKEALTVEVKNINKFNRKNLTEQLAELLDSVAK